MAKHPISTLTFEDLNPGDEWESPARTVTESDVVAFAGLSGDFNPIHVDHHSARQSAFGRPVAHGLLGLSIASGLASHSPRVDTIAFLAIEEWKFLQPIAFGDTVRVFTRVESVQPKARGRRASSPGDASWSTRTESRSRKARPDARPGPGRLDRGGRGERLGRELNPTSLRSSTFPTLEGLL